MKKVLIVISLLSVLSACAKKEAWETDVNEYKRIHNMCRVHSEMKQNDSRVEMPAECEKFAKYYEKKENKPLYQ